MWRAAKQQRIIPALAGNTPPTRTPPTTSPDHPRSRGEYPPGRFAVFRAGGSSPLSRGIRGQGNGGCSCGGIIPALAGNTLPAHAGGGIVRDHPRSRGEYLALAGLLILTGGSSPLSRGILWFSGAFPPRLGIIPALAGNTGVAVVMSLPSPDHPRSRGEYATRMFRLEPRWGSSPLSRGIQIMHVRESLADRIIPALAGNTIALCLFQCARQDHPRSRGEYRRTRPANSSAAGSSPLSRGILTSVVWEAAPTRIIPALAGNTSQSGASSASAPDHPRSRGEYWGLPPWGVIHQGSSPLSRGIHRWGFPNIPGGGIIPALAGNTGLCGCCPAKKQDHPRSRGEYVCCPGWVVRVLGSSPLSRGIRAPGSRRPPPGRIIPALAGNTPQ